MTDRERMRGTGVLLSNRYKKGSGPDWKGEIKLERDYRAGDTVKLAAWTKETSVGALISLKEDNWQPENAADTNQPPRANRNPFPSRRVDSDDDIPF